jgi:ribonuclease Z
MSFEVTILGTSSATPTLSRHPTSQYLVCNNQRILLDCGEGAQMQMLRYGIKMFRIDKIFISHLHPDHYLGLPGYLSTLSLKGRIEPIHVYAPAGMGEILDVHFRHGAIHLTYDLHIHELPSSENFEVIYQDSGLEVSCFALEHRLPCWGFLFKEKKSPFKINEDVIAEKKIPVKAFSYLKKGEDFIDDNGILYSVEECTIPNLPAVSYAYITDTIYLPALAENLRNRDITLLYHEATFMEDLRHKAIETYHSTTLQAANFALKSNAKKLLIGHFSSRYNDLSGLLAEARSVFPFTELAEEGNTFTI